MKPNRVPMPLAVVVIVLIAIFALANHPRPVVQGTGLTVVTSFYPLYFFTHEILGDKASVINITPGGVEPHDYEPSPQDIAHIARSRVLILNGAGLESWGEKIKSNVDPKHTLVMNVADGFATRSLVEDGKSATDPHIWLSPDNALQITDKISAVLSAVDSANAAFYSQNAVVLKSKIEALDAEYKAGLIQCKRRDFVTSHAAFGYLAAQYNLTQIPIAGLSPDAEPSPENLAAIARRAKKDGIKYIFFESLLSPKLSETIAHEIGAQALVLNPIEGLSDDEINSGEDYFSIMRKNLENLRLALECAQ